ncbi:MAG: response regulator [Solirubrobacteraceae bacterium]
MVGDQAEARPRIGVLVVDDHDLFRTGLVSILRAEPDIEIVGQASRGRLGVRLARELDPDVTLMDLRMADLDGIDAIREIIIEDPASRVIALTVATDKQDVEAAVLAGACGYLTKDAPIADILAAIRAAVKGDSWLSPRAANAVLDRVRRHHIASTPRPETEPMEQLSPRELEILRLVARGLENAEIAAELHISPRTAKNHLSKILAKLVVSNRVQAAIYAVRRGLV